MSLCVGKFVQFRNGTSHCGNVVHTPKFENYNVPVRTMKHIAGNLDAEAKIQWHREEWNGQLDTKALCIMRVLEQTPLMKCIPTP